MTAHRLALLLALTAGCGFFESGVKFPHKAVALVDNIAADGWPNDPITIDSLTTTSGGPLRAWLSYGGGCEDHRIALMVERAFSESQPPVLRARIAHEAHGDACKALLHEIIDFDLAIVRDHFHASYPFSLGALALDVQGAPRVTYYFQ